MKQELVINIILGVIAIGIIGIILKNIPPVATVQIQPQTIGMSDFSLHNNAGDCWIRINGNAYNVTSYLSAHPGGTETILPFCGGPDATQAFATKDGRGSHSPRAEQLLKELLVGTLAP